ncbi:hypothetical protein B0H63DRAFT_560477 [Podospora didyma]|uniref:F-box domain-containing protein n=1 Tax=Podospora didyma TaxID=330526 RepID=A0AAE0NQW1_9PEZI|nr:hypothetical protein B0H63DRAFT_560477 [Podospora didyma]
MDSREDAIVRTATLPADNDLALVRFLPHENDQLRDSLLNGFPATGQQASLGYLGCLANEIIEMILREMDIQTIFFSFRTLNKRAAQFVTGLFEFRTLIRHAIDFFCVVVKTNMAMWSGVARTYALLHERSCVECGDIASTIFLPTMERRCLECPALHGWQPIGTRFRTLHQTVKAAKDQVSFKQIRSEMPVLRTLPGTYNERKVSKSYDLVAMCSIEAFYEAHPELGDVAAQSGREMPRGLVHSWADDELLVMANLPILTKPVHSKNPEEIQVETFLHCAGCQTDSPERVRLYTREVFLKHFARCEPAQEVWDTSDEGRSAADVLSILGDREYGFKRYNEKKIYDRLREIRDSNKTESEKKARRMRRKRSAQKNLYRY